MLQNWLSSPMYIGLLGGAIPTIVTLTIIIVRIINRSVVNAQPINRDDLVELAKDLVLYGVLMTCLTYVGLLVISILMIPIPFAILLWLGCGILLFRNTFRSQQLTRTDPSEAAPFQRKQ